MISEKQSPFGLYFEWFQTLKTLILYICICIYLLLYKTVHWAKQKPSSWVQLSNLQIIITAGLVDYWPSFSEGGIGEGHATFTWPSGHTCQPVVDTWPRGSAMVYRLGKTKGGGIQLCGYGEANSHGCLIVKIFWCGLLKEHPSSLIHAL